MKNQYIKEIITSKYLFEEYLKGIHANDYIGLDDDMPDDFDNWLTQLDGEEYIEHGNAFVKLLIDSFNENN